MPSLTSLAVLAAVLCGGAWGWRVGTKRLYRRSIFGTTMTTAVRAAGAAAFGSAI